MHIQIVVEIGDDHTLGSFFVQIGVPRRMDPEIEFATRLGNENLTSICLVWKQVFRCAPVWRGAGIPLKCRRCCPVKVYFYI